MLQQTSDNVMFSLKPRFIEAFLDGSKSVELRRRPPSLPSGTIVWLYGTIPCGQVMAMAKIRHIEVAAISQIWDEFSSELGLEKAEFDEYLAGLENAVAIALDNVSPMEVPVNLDTLRFLDAGFQPPQFFRHIRNLALIDHLLQSHCMPSPVSSRP